MVLILLLYVFSKVHKPCLLAVNCIELNYSDFLYLMIALYIGALVILGAKKSWYPLVLLSSTTLRT